MHAKQRGARKLLQKFSQYAAKFVDSAATEREGAYRRRPMLGLHGRSSGQRCGNCGYLRRRE
jgi:hypothetical protein